MKKKLPILLTLALLAGLAGCGNSQNNSGSTSSSSTETGSTIQNEAPADSGPVLEVGFWSAPNQQQFDFWTQKADAFNSTNTQVNGSTIKIMVQQMPETPSSEAGIQNAIVTGTVPAASENINVGFAAVLAESQAAVPLENEAWFQEICANRTINETMLSGWEIDGSQYVLPLFINPMSLQWNKKALDALGMEVPVTVDDFNQVVQAFIDNKDGSMAELGVTHSFYRPALVRGDQWWERWYDFQMQYQTFSGGKSWVDADTLVLDEAAVKKVFEFYGNLGNTVMTAEINPLWTAETVPVLCSISAPWEVNLLDENGKVYGEDYVYGPVPVEKAGDTAYSFADSKGIVFYQNSSISEDQHQGVVAFIKWVYSAEQATQSDLDWWNTTNMMPVRSDLSTNENFSSITSQSPALAGIAEYIPNAVPCMSHAKMSDIQAALGDNGLASYILETINMEPFHAPDASAYVQQAMDAMRSAGGLN